MKCERGELRCAIISQYLDPTIEKLAYNYYSRWQELFWSIFEKLILVLSSSRRKGGKGG
jgi:hypothetical protein